MTAVPVLADGRQISMSPRRGETRLIGWRAQRWLEDGFFKSAGFFTDAEMQAGDLLWSDRLFEFATVVSGVENMIRYSSQDLQPDYFTQQQDAGRGGVRIWCALSDVHVEQGPPEVVPGSHRVFQYVEASTAGDWTCPNCGASFSLPLGMSCGDHRPQPKYGKRHIARRFTYAVQPLGLERRKIVMRRGDVLLMHEGLLARRACQQRGVLLPRFESGGLVRM